MGATAEATLSIILGIGPSLCRLPTKDEPTQRMAHPFLGVPENTLYSALPSAADKVEAIH